MSVDPSPGSCCKSDTAPRRIRVNCSPACPVRTRLESSRNTASKIQCIDPMPQRPRIRPATLAAVPTIGDVVANRGGFFVSLAARVRGWACFRRTFGHLSLGAVVPPCETTRAPVS